MNRVTMLAKRISILTILSVFLLSSLGLENFVVYAQILPTQEFRILDESQQNDQNESNAQVVDNPYINMEQVTYETAYSPSDLGNFLGEELQCVVFDDAECTGVFEKNDLNLTHYTGVFVVHTKYGPDGSVIDERNDGDKPSVLNGNPVSDDGDRDIGYRIKTSEREEDLGTSEPGEWAYDYYNRIESKSERVFNELVICEQSCGSKSGKSISLDIINNTFHCVTQSREDIDTGKTEIDVSGCQPYFDAYCKSEIDHMLPQPLTYDTTVGDIRDCSVDIFNEKPIGQSIPSSHFRCGESCAAAGMTLQFNQRYRALNNCADVESCEDALVSTCDNACSVQFEPGGPDAGREDILPNSMYNPETQYLKKSKSQQAADKINQGIDTARNFMKLLHNLADQQGTDGVGEMISSMLGGVWLAKIDETSDLSNIDVIGNTLEDVILFAELGASILSSDPVDIAKSGLAIAQRFDGKTSAPYLDLAADIVGALESGNRGPVASSFAVIVKVKAISPVTDALGALAAFASGDIDKGIELAVTFAGKEIIKSLVAKGGNVAKSVFGKEAAKGITNIPFLGPALAVINGFRQKPIDRGGIGIGLLGAAAEGICMIITGGSGTGNICSTIGSAIVVGLDLVKNLIWKPESPRKKGASFMCANSCVSESDPAYIQYELDMEQYMQDVIEREHDYYGDYNDDRDMPTEPRPPTGVGNIELLELEYKTGCAGREDCADEAYLYCNGYGTIPQASLVEQCHSCDTDVFVSNDGVQGREINDGEKVDQKFKDLIFQCAGTQCEAAGGRPSGTSISTIDLMHNTNCTRYLPAEHDYGDHTKEYNIYDSEDKDRGKAMEKYLSYLDSIGEPHPINIDDNELTQFGYDPSTKRVGCEDDTDSCFQKCIEEEAKLYCGGKTGTHQVSEACNIRRDGKKYYCNDDCGVMPGSVIHEDDLKIKYGCTGRDECAYFAKLECINPDGASNPEAAQEIVDNMSQCIAVNQQGSDIVCSPSCGSRSGHKKDTQNDAIFNGLHWITDIQELVEIMDDYCQQGLDDAQDLQGGDPAVCEPRLNGGTYTCDYGCHFPAGTEISKDDLMSSYSCEVNNDRSARNPDSGHNNCTVLAAMYCNNEVMPDPICLAQFKGKPLGDDYYMCNDGCVAPKGRKLMRYSMESVSNQEYCVEADVGGECHDLATRLCKGESQRSIAEIADTGRAQKVVDKGQEWIQVGANHYNTYSSVLGSIGTPFFDGLKSVLDNAVSASTKIAGIAGNIEIFVDLERGSAKDVMTAYSTLSQIYKYGEGVWADVQSAADGWGVLKSAFDDKKVPYDGDTSSWPDSVLEMCGLVGVNREDAGTAVTSLVITQISKGSSHQEYIGRIDGSSSELLESVGGGSSNGWLASAPEAGDGVISQGESCPSLEEYYGLDDEVTSFHAAPDEAVWTVPNTCRDKHDILKNLCLQDGNFANIDFDVLPVGYVSAQVDGSFYAIPEGYTISGSDNNLFILPNGFVEGDLVCNSSQQRDCNPFDDEVLEVYIYDPVSVYPEDGIRIPDTTLTDDDRSIDSLGLLLDIVGSGSVATGDDQLIGGSLQGQTLFGTQSVDDEPVFSTQSDECDDLMNGAYSGDPEMMCETLYDCLSGGGEHGSGEVECNEDGICDCGEVMESCPKDCNGILEPVEEAMPLNLGCASGDYIDTVDIVAFVCLDDGLDEEERCEYCKQVGTPDPDCEDSTGGLGGITLNMTTYYKDADLDGYPDGSQESLEPQDGYITQRSDDQRDCNDFLDNMNPGESEVCDGMDNNCDGVVDEGCATSGACEIDGQCNRACDYTTDSDPECDYDGDGYNAAQGDCNDDPENGAGLPIHPGADEVCDGVDNNCDGVVDDGCDVVECDVSFTCTDGYNFDINCADFDCDGVCDDAELCGDDASDSNKGIMHYLQGLLATYGEAGIRGTPFSEEMIDMVNGLMSTIDETSQGELAESVQGFDKLVSALNDAIGRVESLTKILLKMLSIFETTIDDMFVTGYVMSKFEDKVSRLNAKANIKSGVTRIVTKTVGKLGTFLGVNALVAGLLDKGVVTGVISIGQTLDATCDMYLEVKGLFDPLLPEETSSYLFPRDDPSYDFGIWQGIAYHNILKTLNSNIANASDGRFSQLTTSILSTSYNWSGGSDRADCEKPVLWILSQLDSEGETIGDFLDSGNNGLGLGSIFEYGSNERENMMSILVHLDLDASMLPNKKGESGLTIRGEVAEALEELRNETAIKSLTELSCGTTNVMSQFLDKISSLYYGSVSYLISEATGEVQYYNGSFLIPTGVSLSEAGDITNFGSYQEFFAHQEGLEDLNDVFTNYAVSDNDAKIKQLVTILIRSFHELGIIQDCTFDGTYGPDGLPIDIGNGNP